MHRVVSWHLTAERIDMSQLADLISVFQSAHYEHGVPQHTCATLFTCTLDALEWDHYDIDIEDPGWQRKEHEAAMAQLFAC
jgi:hypothetical protein